MSRELTEVEKNIKKAEEEKEEQYDEKVLYCRWCGLDSTNTQENKPFHIGKTIEDREGKTSWKCMCPRCSNIFSIPKYQRKHLSEDTDRMDIKGHVTVEDDIREYIRENHDEYLVGVKGRIPSIKHSTFPEQLKRTVPKKYWDIDPEEE